MPSSGIATDSRPTQQAWHGSPYRFEQFELERLGSGEGANAYGAGFYFTQSESLARSYTSEEGVAGAAVPTFYLINGTTTLPGTAEQKAADLIFTMSASKAKQLANEMLADAEAGEDWTAEKGLAYYKKVADLTATLTKKEVSVAPGNLYLAEIPSKETLLNWHLMFDEQPAAVVKALRHALLQGDPALAGILLREHTGEALYQKIRGNLGSAAKASGWLRENGIQGIAYSTSGMNYRNQALPWNFVIFDPRDICILKTNFSHNQNKKRAAPRAGI